MVNYQMLSLKLAYKSRLADKRRPDSEIPPKSDKHFEEIFDE